MTLTITTDPSFSETEVGETVAYAFHNGAALAKLQRDHFHQLCAEFESKYGMPSDDFWSRFESGQLGDAADYFDWYAAKRGLDLWEKRYRILSEARL